MMEKQIYAAFIKQIIYWGRITLLAALVLSFAPAIYLALAHDALPPIAAIVNALGIIASVVMVSWIVEPIAYFPILGITGSYMSWLSGNISNLRVPVSAMAQEAAGVKEGTPEGDIVSTLGIGTSVLVNLVVLTVSVFIGIQLIDALPSSLKIAFNYILPAVFGAILASFSMRSPKLGLLAFAAAFVLSMLKFPAYIVLPICVFGTIALGVVMFKKNWL